MMRDQQKRALQLSAILCMAWLFYSLDVSVVSILITNQSFLKTFAVDSDRLGLFSLFPAVGALIGQAGVAGSLSRAFGRRRTFQIATMLIMGGSLMQTFARSWPAVLAGRIMVGIGGDTNGLVLGFYVTEIAPKRVRGRALVFVQQGAGNFIAIAGYWAAYGISYLPQDEAYSWKVANSLQLAPGLAFLLLTSRLPESPRWLARKHPADDAPMLKSLASIRNLPIDHPDVVLEANEIRDYDNWHRVHGSVAWYNVFTQKPLRKRLFHAFIPLLYIQLSGTGVLWIYAVIIYKSLGLSTQQKALFLNACLQVLYALASLGSSYVVERLGRRVCIVWGSLANTIGLACITGVSVRYESETDTIANGWIVAFLVLVTCNSWLFTAGPTVVYINEIMPSQARDYGATLANVVPIAMGITLGQKWPLATTKLGAKSYIIFLCTSGFGFILNWWFVVEPKGLSIERIDQIFGEVDKVGAVRDETPRSETSTADDAPPLAAGKVPIRSVLTSIP